MHGVRAVGTYDPAADLGERYPQWQVQVTSLHGIGEVFDVPRRLILVDGLRLGTQYALAHAVAHLDLGHVAADGGGSFGKQEEADAHWLATMKLDREADRERA